MRLVLVLIVLVAIEGASGMALYQNNRPASAATNRQTQVTVPTPLQALSASPALLLAGSKATFSARVPSLQSQPVAYRVSYADGTTQTAPARTDVSGFSSQTFTLKYVAKNQRETVSVVVLYAGKAVAVTQFSVLLPLKH